MCPHAPDLDPGNRTAMITNGVVVGSNLPIRSISSVLSVLCAHPSCTTWLPDLQRARYSHASQVVALCAVAVRLGVLLGQLLVPLSSDDRCWQLGCRVGAPALHTPLAPAGQLTRAVACVEREGCGCARPATGPASADLPTDSSVASERSLPCPMLLHHPFGLD
jgi:hypothetical protein